MPRQTFFNLPETKARAFLQAAFEEFTQLSYHDASLSAIVRKMGIAKGSAYQYFEHKKDLYFYLIHVARSRKLEYLQPVTDNDGLSFWDLVRLLVEANLRFELENPLQSRFLITVSHEKSSTELGNLRADQIAGSINSLKFILEKEKQRGKLRKDVTSDLMGFMITQLILGLPDYLEYTFGKRMAKTAEESLVLTDSEINEVINDLLKLLQSGLCRTKKK